MKTFDLLKDPHEPTRELMQAIKPYLFAFEGEVKIVKRQLIPNKPQQILPPIQVHKTKDKLYFRRFFNSGWYY